MSRVPEAPLEDMRLLIARIVLAAWGIAFAGAVVFFGVTLILYCAPGIILGPCAPMGLFSAFIVLVGTGAPWVPAYLLYRRARRRPGPGAPSAPA